MDIKELKKLMKQVGGLLVMDGDEPSFVMLSYDNYKELVDEGVGVMIHKETPVAHIGVADYSTSNQDDFLSSMSGKSGEFRTSDEDRINQLNQEIALLKNEIRQREIEHLGGDID